MAHLSNPEEIITFLDQLQIILCCKISFFRIDNLSNPQHKYKVETNATQFLFTGLMLLAKDNNIVIVEGGPKGLRKFKRLMMVRIKWNEDVRNRKSKCRQIQRQP